MEFTNTVHILCLESGGRASNFHVRESTDVFVTGSFSLAVKNPPTVDRSAYAVALEKFDAAICEATAVSQATATRYVATNIGYASSVFTRICGAGTSMIRAAPLSRWTRSDFDDWQFAAVAGHARALLDGYLLFSYLIDPPGSEAELKTRINVVHLNDCTRRIEMHTNLGILDDLIDFEAQRTELQERLKSNEFFTALPALVQKKCLNGRFLMVDSRDSMLAKVGFEKGQFNALYDLWSQHIHILPMSFYRIEPNGRGTGIENDTDRAYIAQALEVCAAVIVAATDQMVEQFPDAMEVRKGKKSTFAPGPESNARKKGQPVKTRSIETSGPIPFTESEIVAAMKMGMRS